GLHGILDHIAKPDMTGAMDGKWRSGIEALAAVPWIYCKISGLVTEAGADWSLERIRPFVEFVARAFGPDRLVFGSDWPVCTLAARMRRCRNSREASSETFTGRNRCRQSWRPTADAFMDWACDEPYRCSWRPFPQSLYFHSSPQINVWRF